MGQLIKTFTDCYYCIFILSLSIFPPTTICTDCDLSTINKDGDDDDDDDEILVENRNFYTPRAFDVPVVIPFGVENQNGVATKW